MKSLYQELSLDRCIDVQLDSSWGFFWALKKLANETSLDSFNNVLIHQIGAISAGIKNGDIYIDLDYEEDSSIDADCNIVINENKDIVDIQATSEQKSFSNDILNKLIHLSSESIEEIFVTQKQILEEK